MRSSICQAAIADGVISPAGGEIVVTRAAGCPSYGAVDFNGVASQVVTDERGEAFHIYPAERTEPLSEIPHYGAIGCDATLNSLPNVKDSTPGSIFLVECRSDCAQAASLLGTSVHAPSSSICRAAQHAGVIGSEGGNVVVTVGHQQERFFGSQNGEIRSEDAPTADRSFLVAKPTAEVLMRSVRVPEALRRFL